MNVKRISSLIRGAPSAFAIRAAGAAATLFVSLLVLRNEASEVAGAFLLCFTIFQISTVLARYGADIYIVRQYYALQDNERRELFGRAAVASLIAGTALAPLAAGVGWLFLKKWAPEAETWTAYSMLLMFFWLPIFASTSLIYYIYQAKHRILVQIIGVNVLQPWLFLLFYLVSKLLPLSSSAGVGRLLLAFSVSIICYAGSSIVLALRAGMTIALTSVIAQVATPKYFWGARAYVTSTLGIQLVGWLPYLLSSFMLGPKFAAIFNLVQRFGMLMSFFSVAINSAAAPQFAELGRKKRFREMEEIFRVNTKRLLALASAFTLCGVLLARIYPVVQGYIMAVDIIMVGYWLNCTTSVCGYYFQSFGKLRRLNISLYAVAGLSPVVTYVLVSRFGILGASVAVLFAVGGVNLVLFPYAVKDLKRKIASMDVQFRG